MNEPGGEINRDDDELVTVGIILDLFRLDVEFDVLDLALHTYRLGYEWK